MTLLLRIKDLYHISQTEIQPKAVGYVIDPFLHYCRKTGHKRRDCLTAATTSVGDDNPVYPVWSTDIYYPPSPNMHQSVCTMADLSFQITICNAILDIKIVYKHKIECSVLPFVHWKIQKRKVYIISFL